MIVTSISCKIKNALSCQTKLKLFYCVTTYSKPITIKTKSFQTLFFQFLKFIKMFKKFQAKIIKSFSKLFLKYVIGTVLIKFFLRTLTDQECHIKQKFRNRLCSLFFTASAERLIFFAYIYNKIFQSIFH